MDNTDSVLIILLVSCVSLLVFVIVGGSIAFRVTRELLNTVITNQMFLSRNVNTRISTASMPTGMPDPTQPPRVQETHQIGRGARSRRRVVGGDPTSAQYADLQGGLPKVKEDEE